MRGSLVILKLRLYLDRLFHIILFFYRSTGGIKAEQAMRTKLNNEEQKKIIDSVKELMKLRRKRAIQISQSISQENGTGDKTTDNVIVSKDYYEKCENSDDSSDESVKSLDQLVREMSDSSEDESAEESVKTNKLIHDTNSDKECVLNIPHNQPLEQHSTTIGIMSKENNHQTNVNQRNENREYLSNREEDVFGNETAYVTKPSIENPLATCTDQIKTLNAKNSTESLDCSNSVFIPDVDDVYKDSDEFCVKKDLILNNDKNIKKENNTLLNNDHPNGTESFFESNKNQSINQNQSSENNKYSVQIEKTSQILCGKRLNTLEIVSLIPNTDDEINLSSTLPSANKVEEIPIQLPWIKPNIKEECHIRERFD